MTGNQPPANTENNPATQMKTINVNIAGKTYPINCPANEEEELNAAIFYINEFIMGIKKQAPNLTQENLLVLCCLNLYEKIHEQQLMDSSQQRNIQVEKALLNKILKDAQSIV